MFDNQSHLLLAFVRYDARDAKGMRRCLSSSLEHTLHKAPDTTPGSGKLKWQDSDHAGGQTHRSRQIQK